MPRATGSTAPDSSLEPDRALALRFAADLASLWPESQRGAAARLGLAVSGGPDSTALLLLAAAALPGGVEAATVDHRLRPESSAEAAEVARLCARLGVPHRILEVDVAPGNMQAEARRARYRAMGAWMGERGLAALATAHHADDQAETLLMRLNRASGVAGLAGARARGVVPGTSHLLLRPLLDWRRHELAVLVCDAGVRAAEDPGNVDRRFDRVRLRQALAAADWLDVSALARSASHLADADAALEWAAQREWTECVRPHGDGLLYSRPAPRAVALRVVARIVRDLDGTPARGGSVAGLLDALLTQKPGSIGNLVARPVEEGWYFARSRKPRTN